MINELKMILFSKLDLENFISDGILSFKEVVNIIGKIITITILKYIYIKIGM